MRISSKALRKKKAHVPSSKMIKAGEAAERTCLWDSTYSQWDREQSSKEREGERAWGQEGPLGDSKPASQG